MSRASYAYEHGEPNVASEPEPETVQADAPDVRSLVRELVTDVGNALQTLRNDVEGLVTDVTYLQDAVHALQHPPEPTPEAPSDATSRTTPEPTPEPAPIVTEIPQPTQPEGV